MQHWTLGILAFCLSECSLNFVLNWAFYLFVFPIECIVLAMIVPLLADYYNFMIAAESERLTIVTFELKQ